MFFLLFKIRKKQKKKRNEKSKSKTSYLKPQPIYLRTKISPTAEEKRREENQFPVWLGISIAVTIFNYQSTAS